MNNSWTIIYYYNSQIHKPIHALDIKNSNPEATVIIADIYNESIINSYPSEVPNTKFYCPSIKLNSNAFVWRNCDRLLRFWLQKNKNIIKTTRVALIEWDVLFTKPLPHELNTNEKVFSIDKKVYNKNEWIWFEESKKLKEYQKYACGLTIMGCLLMDSCIIDEWTNTEFDDLYEQDIFCELRTGTIFNYKNIRWESLSPFMPNIRYERANFDPGILDFYHPIKLPPQQLWNNM